MTYDREVVKIPFEQMRKINSLLVSNPGTIPNVTAQNADKSDEGQRYADLLDEYIKGKRDTIFLKNLALMAIRISDKPGGYKVASSYIRTLKAPLSDEQLKFIIQFTKSSQDAGFAIIENNRETFKKTLGERQLTVNEMNMVYAGEIAPEMLTTATPNWPAIETKVKPYGAAGEEIYLRAKTIDELNKQNWAEYVPTAKAYLEKYGPYLKVQDRTTFQNAINQHQ